jgi:hypothetical protein
VLELVFRNLLVHKLLSLGWCWLFPWSANLTQALFIHSNIYSGWLAPWSCNKVYWYLKFLCFSATWLKLQHAQVVLVLDGVNISLIAERHSYRLRFVQGMGWNLKMQQL